MVEQCLTDRGPVLPLSVRLICNCHRGGRILVRHVNNTIQTIRRT